MKPINKTVANFKETIFATITREAVANSAVNLGQGFPDFDGPHWVIEACKKALERGAEGKNQYAPAAGAPALLNSISQTYRHYYELAYDGTTEITVTNGATEAIFSTSLALLSPGDEVIVFEPYYDSYVASIELAGGKAVPVTLHSPDFTFKEEELRQAFSDKTKAIFFNTPHNPTGRVFTKDEMSTIAQLAREHDCYVISDEVYEFLTFDGAKHIPMATLPNMFERTITISSTGKTFGLTGWKIGWTCAAAPVTHAIRMVHQFNTFCVNHPMQLAMAEALEGLSDYIPQFRKEYSEKRELLLSGLREAGFEPNTPAGTYFAMAPIPVEGQKDVEYCTHLIREKKVATIPPSAFYMKSKEGEGYLRFCFAKKDETIKKAIANLTS